MKQTANFNPFQFIHDLEKNPFNFGLMDAYSAYLLHNGLTSRGLMYEWLAKTKRCPYQSYHGLCFYSMKKWDSELRPHTLPEELRFETVDSCSVAGMFQKYHKTWVEMEHSLTKAWEWATSQPWAIERFFGVEKWAPDFKEVPKFDARAFELKNYLKKLGLPDPAVGRG